MDRTIAALRNWFKFHLRFARVYALQGMLGLSAFAAILYLR